MLNCKYGLTIGMMFEDMRSAGYEYCTSSEIHLANLFNIHIYISEDKDTEKYAQKMISYSRIGLAALYTYAICTFNPVDRQLRERAQQLLERKLGKKS